MLIRRLVSIFALLVLIVEIISPTSNFVRAAVVRHSPTGRKIAAHSASSKQQNRDQARSDEDYVVHAATEIQQHSTVPEPQRFSLALTSTLEELDGSFAPFVFHPPRLS